MNGLTEERMKQIRIYEMLKKAFSVPRAVDVAMGAPEQDAEGGLHDAGGDHRVPRWATVHQGHGSCETNREHRQRVRLPLSGFPIPDERIPTSSGSRFLELDPGVLDSRVVLE